jgi:hypothetical protein
LDKHVEKADLKEETKDVPDLGDILAAKLDPKSKTSS